MSDGVVRFFERAPVLERCPKCGCQIFSPFGGRVAIHDVERCRGLVVKSDRRRF